MDLGGSARLFVANAVWRTTGLPSAGRALVEALSSPDENVRTIAGMFLVQAGRKAEPLLREALARGDNLPLVLSILGDIGDPAFEPELRRFLDHPDPNIAKAARDALRVMQRQQEG
jgi:HEAT repeat protein